MPHQFMDRFSDQNPLPTPAHDAADEWCAPIEAAMAAIAECIRLVKVQAKNHPAGDAEWEATLGHLEDAIGDLPQCRDHWDFEE